MSDLLRDRLLSASAGLLFSTESDRPFEFIRLGARDPISAVMPARIAELVGQPAAHAAEWPFERFLARHIDRVDPLDHRARELTPRYEDLESALRQSLGAVRVFRIGKVEIAVLAIGNDPETGELAGLSTVAVET
ncbi:MAG: nuclease A inhibitor family protein [Gemmatimonadaceae bacterium]